MSSIDTHDLLGLYRCECGNERWTPLSRYDTTTSAPLCHGPMTFTWRFVDRKGASVIETTKEE